MPGYNSPPDKNIYYALVWGIIGQIPFGCVATYGQIARMIPPPHGVDSKAYLAWAPRWVGGAMAACPEGVPWHRVINSQGKISLRGGSDQSIQKHMLESEGVQFNTSGKVDLNKFGWKGIDQ
jgi:methylated-DNA-protein-cysteine methyltransferase-like protein